MQSLKHTKRLSQPYNALRVVPRFICRAVFLAALACSPPAFDRTIKPPEEHPKPEKVETQVLPLSMDPQLVKKKLIALPLPSLERMKSLVDHSNRFQHSPCFEVAPGIYDSFKKFPEYWEEQKSFLDDKLRASNSFETSMQILALASCRVVGFRMMSYKYPIVLDQTKQLYYHFDRDRTKIRKTGKIIPCKHNGYKNTIEFETSYKGDYKFIRVIASLCPTSNQQCNSRYNMGKEVNPKNLHVRIGIRSFHSHDCEMDLAGDSTADFVGKTGYLNINLEYLAIQYRALRGDDLRYVRVAAESDLLQDGLDYFRIYVVAVGAENEELQKGNPLLEVIVPLDFYKIFYLYTVL